MNGMAEEKGWLLVRESESGGRRESLFDLMEEGKLQSGFPRPTQFSLFSSAEPYLPPLPFVTDIPSSSLTGQRQIDHPKRPSRGFSRNKQSSHIIIESANEKFIHAARPIRHSKTRGLGRRCLNRIGKWYVHPPRWWGRLKFESRSRDRSRKHAVSLQHIPHFS